MRILDYIQLYYHCTREHQSTETMKCSIILKEWMYIHIYALMFSVLLPRLLVVPLYHGGILPPTLTDFFLEGHFKVEAKRQKKIKKETWGRFSLRCSFSFPQYKKSTGKTSAPQQSACNFWRYRKCCNLTFFMSSPFKLTFWVFLWAKTF